MSPDQHLVEALRLYARLSFHLEQAYPAVKQSGWQEMFLNAIARTASNIKPEAG